MSTLPSSSLNYAKGLIKFIDNSPTPYHAVASVKDILINFGFKEIHEQDHWTLKPNDMVFVTKNHSTIIALTIGGNYKPGNGFSMIGAHTDSPCLKLKPNSEQISNTYLKLGVETYGGGLWYTWFDRDLTVAGRCIVRESDRYKHMLVNLRRPIARVPTLAIHLDRSANDSFAPNKEFHLSPVLCTTIEEQINKTYDHKDPSNSPLRHPIVLMTAIAEELKVKVENIVDVELCLADSQPAVIGGINEEFIFAPRLDNLFNCFASVHALTESLESVSHDTNIRAVCLYDNEEIGSESAQGAKSAFTELILRRVVNTICEGIGSNTCSQYERAIANSLLISADQAHAVHPNYEEKHERHHKPLLHKGIVLKVNSNQRYASNAMTTSLLREVAKAYEVPLQEFVVRQDMMCGSTIGPIMSANMGLATVDVGGPQLSMHSCREMAGVSSVEQAVRLFKGFFVLYPDLSHRMRLGIS